MSAGVCFKSEHGGWLQDQWSWVFSNFGIADIWERDFAGADAKIYQPTIKIDTASELPLTRRLVVLAHQEGRYIKGDQSLVDFVHPDNAIYLFGGSHDNLNDEDDLGGRVPDALVFIPTIEHECFGHAAAYMTLWDRYVKRGGFG
jgi:hypothetical protein